MRSGGDSEDVFGPGTNSNTIELVMTFLASNQIGCIELFHTVEHVQKN